MRRRIYARQLSATGDLLLTLLALVLTVLKVPFMIVGALFIGTWRGYKEDLRIRKTSRY